MAGPGNNPASDHFVAALAEKEPAVTGGLTDLFAPCVMDDVLQGGSLSPINPITMDPFADYYDFPITPRGDQYILPSATQLFVETKIVKKDGSDLTAAEALSVAVICNFAASLFKSITTIIKGTGETQLIDHCAHFKSYVTSLLSYGQDARNSHLKSHGWQVDSPGQFDTVSSVTKDTANNEKKHANYGFLQRCLTHYNGDSDATKGTKLVQYVIPLNGCDFLQSKRLYPSGFDLKFRFEREKDDFLLLHNADTNPFKVYINKIKLYIRYVDVHPDVLTKHRASIARNLPIIYPIHKTQVVTKEFAASTTHINWPGVFNCSLPKSFLFFMVESAAYLGNVKLNPWNFKHFGANHISVKHNGKQYPEDAFEPRYDLDLFTREYRYVINVLSVG